MSRKQRRGARPTVTVFLSERRVPGARVFEFAQAGTPARATLTARAFSWDADAPVRAGPPAAANEPEFEQFLRGLRTVYRGSK